MSAPPPLITDVSRPFWDGLRQHRVYLQQCNSCGSHIHYPRAFCPHCGGRELQWAEVSGRGHIYSFTVAELPVSPDFADGGRLVLAMVELVEGPRLATTIVGIAPDDVAIGLPVTPFFDDDSFDSLTLLRFASAG